MSRSVPLSTVFREHATIEDSYSLGLEGLPLLPSRRWRRCVPCSQNFKRWLHTTVQVHGLPIQPGHWESEEVKLKLEAQYLGHCGFALPSFLGRSTSSNLCKGLEKTCLVLRSHRWRATVSYQFVVAAPSYQVMRACKLGTSALLEEVASLRILMFLACEIAQMAPTHSFLCRKNPLLDHTCGLYGSTSTMSARPQLTAAISRSPEFKAHVCF